MSKQVTEYAVRTINADGDCVDVEHYSNKHAALNVAEAIWQREQAAKAVVVEREVSKWAAGRDPHLDDPDKRTAVVIYTKGDREALLAGGWIAQSEQVAR